MKREINITKLILDNYTTEEVIAYVVPELSKLLSETPKDSQVIIMLDILEGLNKKLGGKKGPKVL